MMTLEDMKLAVCEKLPELMSMSDGHAVWEVNWKHPQYATPVNWPTEGLQVCHEAEKLLNTNEKLVYVRELCSFATCHLSSNDPTVDEIFCVCFAAYEQRLAALCRVWFP